MNIKIEPNGEITAIYNDNLVELFKEGKTEIKRASHVEPNNEGMWVADLFPIGGPILGPYEKRKDALDAELEWLDDFLFEQQEFSEH